MLKRVLILIIILLYAQIAFAATAGNVSDPKIPYGPGIFNTKDSGYGPITLSFDGEWIFDRDLDDSGAATSADLEGQQYLFKVGYTFAEVVQPYITLGVSTLRTFWNQGGQELRVKAEEGLVIGGGGKVHVFEIPDNKLKLSLDGHYLYTDAGIQKSEISGISRSVSAEEFTIAQWQITGIISMEFPLNYDRYNSAAVYSLIPYVGLAYFDSAVDTKFTFGGTDYSIGDTDNKDKFLLIGGLDFTSPENIVFNVEGRFIGEMAASSGLTVKF